MKRIMVRLPDALYAEVFEASHDARTSINAWVIRAIEEKIDTISNKIN